MLNGNCCNKFLYIYRTARYLCSSVRFTPETNVSGVFLLCEKREIREELDTEISVGELIDTIEYDYSTFHLSMDCFWCEIVKGDLVLKEHEAAQWLNKKSMNDVDWLPADITLIEKIREKM